MDKDSYRMMTRRARFACLKKHADVLRDEEIDTRRTIKRESVKDKEGNPVLNEKGKRTYKMLPESKWKDIGREDACPPVHLCHRYPIPGEEIITLLKVQSGAVHASGVLRCTSVWSCPVCAEMILKRRAEEIRTAEKQYDGKKHLTTYTARHKAGNDLKDMIERIRLARADFGRTQGYRRHRKEQLGYISSSEITLGKNGWHFHIHEESFSEHGPRLQREWVACLKKHGLEGVAEYAYDTRESWNLSEYLTKLADWGADGDQIAETKKEGRRWDTASEMSATKAASGRTAFSLGMDDDVTPKQAAWERARIIEHYHATRGRRRIVWSKGLKSMFGIGELTDAELADPATDPKEDTTIVAMVPAIAWTEFANRGEQWRLLEAAEKEGAEGVTRLIRTLYEGNK